MACYHSQQCAEKYLKGFLTAHSMPFRYVHDLVYLTQLCTTRDPEFERLMLAAEILDEYGVTMRYPTEVSEEPNIDAAREAVQLAKQFADLTTQS